MICSCCLYSFEAMTTSKLKEFSGYTSIHGIGRIGDAKFIIRKLFWICVCLASFSMAIYQITRLVGQYTSESVNTKISTSFSALDFPSVTFCNLNPLSYKRAKKNPAFYQVVNTTAHTLKLDISQFDGNVQPTTEQHTSPYNPGVDPVTSAKEQIHLRMGSFGDSTIFQLTASPEEFIILCSYQGNDCSNTSIRQIRDEYYGTCYTFTPPIIKTRFAGPSFALELLLDVQQDDFIPIVTQSAGIRMAVHPNGTKPFLTSEGISIATKFETHVVLQQKRSTRYPGSKGERCDKNNTFSGVLPCMEACIGHFIAKVCRCLTSYDYVSLHVHEMCTTRSHIFCKNEVEKLAIQNSECDCKMPCSQITYDKSIFMTSYPAENYGIVLNDIMNSTAESLSDSMVKVKVFFSSLTEEHVEEELAYTEENFVSDIGGQLGLWAGFSVLSLVEVLELIVILIHACFTRRKADVGDFDKE